MKVVIGLGNPGSRYARTRHNVGFDVVDALARSAGGAFKRSWRLHAQSGKITISGRELMVVKPQGFMNRSGETAVRLRRRGVAPEDMLVVVDDVDLAPGDLRVRARGSAGGHNGLKSIIESLGSEEFPRLRVGVGPKPAGADLVEHVLGRFRPDEREAVNRAIPEAVAAIRCWIEDGVVEAMNRFNARKRAGATKDEE